VAPRRGRLLQQLLLAGVSVGIVLGPVIREFSETLVLLGPRPRRICFDGPGQVYPIEGFTAWAGGEQDIMRLRGGCGRKADEQVEALA